MTTLCILSSLLYQARPLDGASVPLDRLHGGPVCGYLHSGPQSNSMGALVHAEGTGVEE
jgi:hypothetical protein